MRHFAVDSRRGFRVIARSGRPVVSPGSEKNLGISYVPNRLAAALVTIVLLDFFSFP
jgi:hypothetical protein